jgi:hypothetical protein
VLLKLLQSLLAVSGKYHFMVGQDVLNQRKVGCASSIARIKATFKPLEYVSSYHRRSVR